MNTLTKKLLKGGAIAAATIWGTHALLRHLRWFEFAGKSVIVTGGSRGLGLVLSRLLVEQGARIAICARTEADLETAEGDLRSRGGQVLAIRCDVRDREDVNRMVQQVVKQFGTVDVLFNVAGIIQVGPLDAMTRDDFENAMATHFWGPLNTIEAVLPHMRKRGWGRIVNISSIGGKQAVPHLIPYSASKFALVGLSNALRTELAHEGILVTTVCPSLMRTGSPRNALFKGQHRKEYTWFSIGDALPVVSMDATKAARQILRACQRGEGEVTLSNWANPGVLAQHLAPQFMTELLCLVGGVLPGMGGIGRQSARGYDSHSAWSPSILTRLSDRAAEENNEMRQHPIPTSPPAQI